jgi:hypothetical protein
MQDFRKSTTSEILELSANLQLNVVLQPLKLNISLYTQKTGVETISETEPNAELDLKNDIPLTQTGK